jgi:ferric-dicitrate binding protein FerR (iron transport regulator)
MMDQEELLQVVSHLLADEVDDQSNAQDEVQTLATLNAMRGVLQRRKQRQKWLAVGAAACIAAAAAVFLVQKPTRAPADVPYLTVDGHLTVTQESSAEGARADTFRGTLVAPNEVGTVQLRDKSQLRVQGRLTVLAAPKEQRFQLESGSVTAQVAKQKPDDAFVVQTDDLQVTVRGTAFTVTKYTEAVCPQTTLHSQVQVAEGTVVVTFAAGSVVLHAGEQWPSCARHTSLDPKPSEASEVTSAALPSEAALPSPTASATAAKLGISTLKEENDVFAEAVSAKKRGDLAGALRAYESLETKYPRSPLLEAALADHMRILARTNPFQAELFAKRYLARFPHGSSRAEAQRILAQANPQ